MALNDVKEIQIPGGVSPYRQLEYIKFSGAEYVDTGYKPATNTFHYLNVSFDSTSTEYCPIGCAGDSTSSGNQRILFWTRSGYIQSRYGRNSSVNENIYAYSANTQYLLKMRLYSDNRAWFAVFSTPDETQLGTHYYSTTTSWTSSNMVTFKLGCYTYGTTTNTFLQGKIYRHYMKTGDDSGEITYDRYPCQRKSDGVCGMYDVKTNTFLPMTGTTITSGAAGPIVDENPDWDRPTVKKMEDSNGNIIWGSASAFPYRRLEYVHLNGTNNYINTGLKPNYPKNRAIWIKADSDLTATSARVIGSYASSSSDNARRCYFIANRDGGFGFSLGNQWVGGKATAHKNDKVLMYGTINSTGKTTSWGIKSPDDVTTYDSGSITTGGAVGQTANIAIGTNLNDAGNPDTTVYFKGNIYLYRIKDTNGSGPIETEMYPVQRKSDGAYGMYDIYLGLFHTIEGTQDSSSGGPVIDEYWDLTAPS